MKNFASTDAVRVDLEGGEWVEFKTSISVADFRHIRRGAGTTRDDVLINLAHIAARITDWSLRDERGVKVPFSDAAFDALTTERAREIGAALDRFDTQADPEGNAPAGETVTTELPKNDAPTSSSAA